MGATRLKYIAVEETPDLVQVAKSDSFSINMLTELFERELAPVETDGVAKVIVKLDTALSAAPTIENMIDVLRVHWPFSLASYVSLSELERKRRLVAALHDALTEVAKQCGWKGAAFADAQRCCEQLGYVYTGQIGKPVRRKGQKLEARSVFDYQRNIYVCLTLNDAREAIPYARFPASIEAMNAAIGKLSFESDDVVRIEHKNKRDYWRVELCSRLARFHNPRADEGDAHAQYALGMAYVEGRQALPDTALAKEWFERAAAQGFARARQALEKL